jgi:hypothetical protein
MLAEIKGKNLIITIPFDEKGRPSSTGKSMIHSTTGKEPITVDFNGKKLTVSVNAYSSAK